MSADTAILDLVGIRVLYVDDLRTDALLLPDEGLLLIDSTADPDNMPQIVDQVLSLAVEAVR